jgi:hypothetical protein
VGFRWETENQGKSQGRAENPNTGTDLFDDWGDRFQHVGGGTETGVAAASLLPP